MARDGIARADYREPRAVTLSYTMCLVQACALCEHDKEFCYGDITTGIFHAIKSFLRVCRTRKCVLIMRDYRSMIYGIASHFQLKHAYNFCNC